MAAGGGNGGRGGGGGVRSRATTTRRRPEVPRWRWKRRRWPSAGCSAPAPFGADVAGGVDARGRGGEAAARDRLSFGEAEEEFKKEMSLPELWASPQPSRAGMHPRRRHHPARPRTSEFALGIPSLSATRIVSFLGAVHKPRQALPARLLTPHTSSPLTRLHKRTCRQAVPAHRAVRHLACMRPPRTKRQRRRIYGGNTQADRRLSRSRTTSTAAARACFTST